MSEAVAELYEADFVRWAEAQSAALREAARAGTNLPLDWEHLAEEVESLGRSQKRELRSRLDTILEHLLKLEYSQAAAPRPGWRDTVRRERSEIELLLEDSPSLRGQIGRLIVQQAAPAARATASSLSDHGEPIGQLPPPRYTEEQVLGDWFPAAPNPAA